MIRVSYFNFHILQLTWILATDNILHRHCRCCTIVESFGCLKMLEEPSSNESTAPVNPPFESDVGFKADASLGSAESQYQLQLLKQEVSELRGLVEELTYQLQRLSSVSDDRYLELDRRFQDVQASVYTLTTTAPGLLKMFRLSCSWSMGRLSLPQTIVLICDLSMWRYRQRKLSTTLPMN